MKHICFYVISRKKKQRAFFQKTLRMERAFGKCLKKKCYGRKEGSLDARCG